MYNMKKTKSKNVYLLIEVSRKRIMILNTFVVMEASILLIDLALMMIIKIKNRLLNNSLIIS